MSNTNQMNTAGWDIGGAHLKLALRSQDTLTVYQWPCPLWRGLNELIASLNAAFDQIGNERCMHHLTMTGELVDIFADRNQGVKQILDTFIKTMRADDDIKVFASKELMHVDKALENTHLVASANWLASGYCLSNYCANALFVDMGSTTTDVLLVQEGKPCNIGFTDAERLRSGELVYTGIVRSCVNTISHHILYQGELIPMMAENFAVSADVYRVLELLPEHADSGETMDGQAKDKQASARRLARMIGEDYAQADDQVWEQAATYISGQQKNILAKQIMNKLAPLHVDKLIVGAGVGRFLIQQIAAENNIPYVDFAEKVLANQFAYNNHAADCAPAVSLALL